MSNSTSHHNLENKEFKKIHGVEKNIAMLFTSKDATLVNSKGNAFQVNLYNPISIPKNALGCKVGLYSANIWNSVPNISPGENDTLYVEYPSGVFTQIVLPQGLYGLTELNLSLQNQFTIAGLPSDLIIINGDVATQKTLITFNYADIQIDFTQADTFKGILGFNAILVPNTASMVGQLQYSNTIAKFNNINSFLITAPELVGNGLPLNATAGSILGEIPITSSSNSLITYTASQVLYVQMDSLIGNELFNLNFRLTDENLNDIIIIEPFSFIVNIKYSV